MARRNSNLPAVLGSKNDVEAMLVKLAPSLTSMLPQWITPDKMAHVCLTAIHRTPKLLQCSQRSFIGAVLECVMIGLYPDGTLGHAYLIPFKGHVQLIVGYKGFIHLGLQSGKVTAISGQTVHEGDFFEFEEGTAPFIKHKTKVPKHDDSLTHAYAIARLKDAPADPTFVVVDKVEIDRVKARSPGGGGGTWASDYVAMARKTPIRRLHNFLQLSNESGRAAHLDELAASGIHQRLDASAYLEALPGATDALGPPSEPAPGQNDMDQDNVRMPGASSAPQGAPAGRGQSRDDTSRPRDGRPQQGRQGPGDGVSDRQIKRLFAIGYNTGWDSGQMREYVDEVFKKEPEELTRDEYDAACTYLEEHDHTGADLQ